MVGRTAYFLARRGIDVIVVERTEVAAAASGKVGVFLALDWCAGTPLDAPVRIISRISAP
jgi:glycine/D-amino acid oxidase-like deaminating enzyme